MLIDNQFKMYFKNKTNEALIISFLTLFVSLSCDARLYKWVDANGEVRYGDRLPQEFANKKHFQLDGEGRIIQTKEAGKSPQQLKKERELNAKKAKEKEEAEKKAHQDKIKQDNQDRILLLTFNSEDDIFYSRDQRLLVLDSKANLLRKNKELSQKKLQALEDQASNQYRSKNFEVPGGLQQKIEQMSKNILSIDSTIKRTEDKRSDVISGFKKDLVRFRDLKARQRKK